MKIAMIGHKRIPSREGGVEVVVQELATRMVKMGHEVTCYNRKGKNVLDKNKELLILNNFKGIRIKHVFTIDKKGLAAICSSFFGTIMIMFSKNNIVHFHAEGPCVMIPIIKIFTRKKIIATIHGLDWRRAKWGGFASKYIKYGEKMAAKYADEIIVLSQSVQDYFKREYGINTIYIPNGVNKMEFKAAKIIKEKYALSKNDYILYLGRIVPEKGIHYLIEAFMNLDTEKKLVIAGGASDTDAYLKGLICKSNSCKNIIFTGYVEGEILEELYSNAYIYCLPSDLEGMPLSLLEAMSYRNCCLTSDIPECSTVLGGNGFIFKKSDIDDLTDKLSYLLNNPIEVKIKKDRAQKYVLSHYSWDEIVKETLKVYQNND